MIKNTTDRSTNQFTEKYIAFIDVLGFKSLVAQAEQGGKISLPYLLDLLKCLGTGAERAKFDRYGATCCPDALCIEKNLDFCVTQISDCVVVSAEVSPAGLINLISHCSGAVINLLENGIMCRGYINRGLIYHTESQIIGSGYQDAYAAESKVSAFKREATERGTPFVEIDPNVVSDVEGMSDTCVKEIFARHVKHTGNTLVLFPFHYLAYSAMGPLDPEKETQMNQNVRILINMIKDRVESFVDPSIPSAVSKSEHYIMALNKQLDICDRSDELIKGQQCMVLTQTIDSYLPI
jgi:hypothetical protein